MKGWRVFGCRVRGFGAGLKLGQGRVQGPRGGGRVQGIEGSRGSVEG